MRNSFIYKMQICKYQKAKNLCFDEKPAPCTQINDCDPPFYQPLSSSS